MGGEVRNRSFGSGDMIETDGGRFIDCEFRDVEFLYGGGEHPKFENCTFENTGWRFVGAALRTIQFLQMINAAPDGKQFIDDIFAPGKYFA